MTGGPRHPIRPCHPATLFIRTHHGNPSIVRQTIFRYNALQTL